MARVTEEEALKVEGLGKAFGGVDAVKGASFSIAQGSVTGLIGPNGAGKSTTLAIIAGEIRPTTGSVRFMGTETSGMDANRIARMGLVRTFQLPSVFSRLTVIENLLVAGASGRHESLWAAIRGRRRWGKTEDADVERAGLLLERFQLSGQEDEYAGDLSGGQKRLLELTRALMARPKLLLLDEPMAGVSPALVRRVERHLLQLKEEGLTMLMVEHELGTVDRLCDSVIAMANGNVIAEGSMKEVRANHEVLDAYLMG